MLRWYGTPCNIFKKDRILKNDYNHGFKNFKIYDIWKFEFQSNDFDDVRKKFVSAHFIVMECHDCNWRNPQTMYIIKLAILSLILLLISYIKSWEYAIPHLFSKNIYVLKTGDI